MAGSSTSDVTSCRQALAALAIAVAPHDTEAEMRRTDGISGIRRLERDALTRDAEPVDGQLIDFRMRLNAPNSPNQPRLLLGGKVTVRSSEDERTRNTL